MDGLLHGFVTEIVIVAVEAVIFFPFFAIDYWIVKKIVGLGFSGRNWLKIPIAIATMFAGGVAIWCILGGGLDFAVFDNDVYAALVVASALCAFAMAWPVCDLVRYMVLAKKKKSK